MGDDAIRAVPARSGCLKWTCGCLAVAAVLSLAALVGGWYALSGWTPAGSAWENLPPGTLFALEANSVGSLLETAAEDPGALSLASAVLRAYQTFLEKNAISVEGSLPRTAYESLSSFSWLYTAFFPNYVLFGARGFDPEELFLIAQPPRWFAWTAGAAMTEGSVEEIADGQGARFFLAFVGEYVAAALNRDIVQHVVDNWAAKSAPLGAPPGRGDAYVMLAARSGERGGMDAGGADSLSGGGGFMLDDPFAAPAAVNGATRFQAIVSPAASGWNLAFENIDAAKPNPPAGFAAHIDTEFGAENPSVVMPDASDIEVALRMPKATLKRMQAALVDVVPPRFGGDWLGSGWLDRAGGMFTLLASRPVDWDSAENAEGMEDEAGGEREAPPYPPLPVLTLGWNLSSLHAPVPFANHLGEWLDSPGAPGGVLPRSVAKALLSYEVAADGLSGAVSIPPVLANGARPAWKFMLETIPSMGWMATDPSGLPEPSLLPRLAAPLLPEPAVDHAAVVTNWDMSRVFIDAVEAVATDRLRQLPDGWFENLPMGKEDFADALHTVGQLFTAYPRGVVKADVNTGTREAVGKAFIPFGMSVDIE